VPRPIQLESIYSLSPVEEGGEILRVETSDPTEYFLVEFRGRRGFDDSLPGQGVLVWHVDDEQVSAGLPDNTVNADEAHYGVGLEQADGDFELEAGSNRGDAGDPFPGALGSMNPNYRFDGETVPSSVTFSGLGGVEIEIVEITTGSALVRIRPPQGDLDSDGVEDGEDLCPLFWDPDQLDTDGDGVGDACDNCVLTPNAPPETAPPDRTTTGGQPDGDADGIGNACDADFTRKGAVVNVADLLHLLEAFGRPTQASACPDDDGSAVGPCDRYDLDGDADLINVGDLLVVLARIGTDPTVERCPACPLECVGPACP
jgi:hypothetical protein